MLFQNPAVLRKVNIFGEFARNSGTNQAAAKTMKATAELSVSHLALSILR